MRWVAIQVALVTLLVLSPAPVPAATNTIQITAKEFSFTPATITLRAGRPNRIQITNKGTMDHEFLTTLFKSAKDQVVEVEGVRVEAEELEETEIEPGKTVTLTLTPARAGRHPFWCAEVFQGKVHRDLGMRGVIRVVP